MACPSLQKGIGLNATGMAVLEADLPSGFGLATPPDELTALHHYYQQKALKKVESPPGKVILYLDSVSWVPMTPLSSALPPDGATVK